MHRSLLVALSLCCLPACFPPPGSPGILETPVTGDWTGTFDSNWGSSLPMRATLENIKYTQSISGSFIIDGHRPASGTLYGGLQTHAKDDPGLFHGTMTISYLTPAGEVCRSTTGAMSGSASERSISFSGAGFTSGNCPDPPIDIRMTLRR